jgi:ribonuclease HI
MRSSSIVTLFVDGASRGNPGPASIGCSFVNEAGDEIASISEVIGSVTNNIAEYTALLFGLEKAIKDGISHIQVKADSELMVKQMKGEYKVKNEGLKNLFVQTLALSKQFKSFSIQHVRREQNSRADELANLALDSL